MYSVSSNRKIYTVSQLNRETKRLLTEHFFTIQVEGEISNLSLPSSGHIYFSLKDENSQIRCAMFRMQRRQLGFKPENGNQVVVTAQVSLYEARGDYQLVVEKMEEAGDGALRRAYEALKLKLSEEGLFDQACKKPLPKLPAAIGVITSPTGAAIRDILSVVKRRFPAVPVIIYPVAVQGESAKNEIVKAITTANIRQECDVIILSRGGGSLEDLWAFNEEIVARAIFSSDLPIVSGIGHEIDFTIADFVSDLRAPTPSAAAEHIIPDQQELLRQLQHFESRIIKQIQNKLLQHFRLLEWTGKRLDQQHPGKILLNKMQRLDELEINLNRLTQMKLQHCSAKIDTHSARLWQHNPADKIKTYSFQQQYLEQRLKAGMIRYIEKMNQQLAKTSQTLQAVSPLATLNRGYAIVTREADSRVVTSAEHLRKGELIKTRLAKGQLISQIKEIQDV